MTEVNANTLVDNFIQLYQALNKDNLHLLERVYDDKIIFADPMHQIIGLPALTQYFAKLYKNIQHIQFDIKEVQQNNSQAHYFGKCSIPTPS